MAAVCTGSHLLIDSPSYSGHLYQNVVKEFFYRCRSWSTKLRSLHESARYSEGPLFHYASKYILACLWDTDDISLIRSKSVSV